MSPVIRQPDLLYAQRWGVIRPSRLDQTGTLSQKQPHCYIVTLDEWHLRSLTY